MRFPPPRTWLILANLGFTSLLVAAPSPDPMDVPLLEFRKRLDAALEPDTARYQALGKGSPRALLRFQGEIYRFPPIPEMEPSGEELGNTYPLAALPPEWIGPLNDIGRDLFDKGLADGRQGKLSPAWENLRTELEGIDVPRVEIPTLGEVAPGFDSKFDYARAKVPFQALEAARHAVEDLLGKVQGGRRSQVLNLADDEPHGQDLVTAFQRHEEAAQAVGVALRNKIEGLCRSGLIGLQAEVYGALTTKLGRPPKAQDVPRFGQLMSPSWRKLIRWNHARHYWAGYRAVAGHIGGGTGDGQGGEEFQGQGTGSGSGASSFQGQGTGDGSGTPEGGSGSGTGDGTAKSDPSQGAGTGSGGG